MSSSAAPRASARESATSYALEQLEPTIPEDPGNARTALLQASDEAQALREQARREGFARGHAEGLEQGMDAARSAAAALGEATDGVRDSREEMTGALEEDAVALALALAEKIIAGTIEVQPERILDVLRGALRHVADRRRITILVNPDDMELVGSAIDELRGTVGGIELCEIHADRRISRGGSIVRTTEGEVDASLEIQLEQAREQLAADLGASSLAAQASTAP